MSINVVPNPLTDEPQNLGTSATPWDSAHANNLHTQYIRLHSFNEPLVGLPEAVIELQNQYSGDADGGPIGVPEWTNILHMRQSGLYVGSARVVMSAEVDVVTSKLDAFFGRSDYVHLGLSSHYPHLEDGWDSLVEIIARIKGLHTLVTSLPALEARVAALEALPPGEGGGATALNGLTDVTITAPSLSDGQVLRYSSESGQWHNSDLNYDDLAGKPDLFTENEADAKYALINHTHSEYAVTSHTHSEYATVDHNHDGVYATAESLTALQTTVNNLPEPFSGDYNDLINTPTVSSGVVSAGTAPNINVADGAGGFSATDWVITASTVTGVAEPLTMAGHILPNSNATHDIGSAEYKIRHLYLSDNSIQMAPADNSSTTRISFDTSTDSVGELVSSTERPYTMSDLELEFSIQAYEVIDSLLTNQKYESSDPKTGRTIIITGDSSYWSTATGSAPVDHADQTLTYTVRYTLNRDNVVIGQGNGISANYSDGLYTIAADESILATKVYVDGVVDTIVDANTEYTFAGPLVLDPNTNNVTFNGSAYTYTGDTTYISVSENNVISLNTSDILLTGALDDYQQTLSVSDTTNLSITNDILSLNALKPYKPGINGNLPLDGVGIAVSQARGVAETSKDGALLPTYYQLDNIRVSTITKYLRIGDTVEATYDPTTLSGSLAQQRAVTMPNTSMYFTPVLGDQFTPLKAVVDYASSVFTTFHDEMVAAGWSTATASAMFNSTGDLVNVGDIAYSDGDRAVHPALHVVQPGGEVVSLEVPADGIITERLRVRAYSGSPTAPMPMRGNVFLYTIDQNRSGLDTSTRKVYAIGPVLRYQDQTASKITTKITPLYSDEETVDPATFSSDPTSPSHAAGLEHLQYVNDAVNAVMPTQGKVEIGYYTVWESSVFSPDSGAIPHGARLRFHRDATVITEAEGVLGHVSYQNVWLPEPVSHDYARLPGDASFQSLYVNHLEVTSNNSSLFSNGVHILNTDVTTLTGDSGYDHDTMDSGLLVATSGGVVGASSAKRFDSFAALYYDASSDAWRITRSGSGGASVTGSEATYVKTDGTTVFINDASGRPTSDLRGTRIDANGNSSERILTESDIAGMVTATTLSHYATASSLTNLATTVENLSLTTDLASLTDVNVVAASLTSGQYLKWDESSDKWVAGSASDFTTGVTTINGKSGAVTIDTDDVSEGSTNQYYTDTRVNTYLTANSYATEGYVDTAVNGLATTGYVDTAVANLIDTAPSTLDTLNELAAALGDDANFATNVTDNIATKADKSQTITAGTGIVTSGSLGAGVTVSLATITGLTAGTFGSATKVPSLTVDTYGRVTAATLVDVHNFSGDYNDLTNKPNLFDGAYSSLSGAPVLSTVATTGSYNDLGDKPLLFDGSYSSLTETPTLFDGAYSSLSGTPTLSTVATTGSYNDLTDKPNLFSGSYDDLTDRPSLFDGTYASLTGTPDLTDNATQTYVTDAVAGFITASSVSNNYALQSTLDSTKIIDLEDVSITAGSLTAGEYLKWSGSAWVRGSASDFTTGVTSVTGGTGINVSDNAGAVTVSADTSVLATAASLTALSNTVAGKQDAFTLGTGLTLSNGTLSATVSLAGLASEAYVDTAVSALVDAAPGTLDTLNELAAALGDDANFATTVTSSIATKQDQLTAGSNVTITTASTISVDLSAYATANTLNNYVLTTTADSTYADATATANSLNALSSRVDGVEAFTITIADNNISIDGGIIAAATLTNALSTTMSTALGISDLATAESLSAVKTVVDNRVDVTSLGTGLTLSSGQLSATVDLSDYSTSTQIANTYLTQTAAGTTYADKTTTASSITALDGRLDTIESDYLTSSSTLSSAKLNNKSVTVAGLSVDLGGAITANSLSTALSLSSYATAATLSNYTTTTDFAALEATVDGRQSITAIDGDLSLSTAGTLSTSFSISNYATTAQLGTKQDTLTAGSNISITGSTIAVSSTLSDAVSLNSAKDGYTTSAAQQDARLAISATGDISYDSSTGLISYTSQWATDSGKITTENVVLVPGHLIEVFDMGADLTNQPDFTLDAGTIAGSVDRIVDCGILDQERLF
jgi:hypothetical protein